MCVKLALHSTKSQQRTLSALKDLVSVAAKVLQGAFPLTEPTIVGTDVSCKIFFEKKKKTKNCVSSCMFQKLQCVQSTLHDFQTILCILSSIFFLIGPTRKKGRLLFTQTATVFDRIILPLSDSMALD